MTDVVVDEPVAAKPVMTEPEAPVVKPTAWIPEKPDNVIDAGSK